MELKNFQEPALVSLLFFIVSSDWFDNWLKELFPSLETTNPVMYTLLKTIIFGLLYWLVKYVNDHYFK